MSLDKRMRAAHQQQLDEAQRAYENAGSPAFSTGRAPTGRYVLAAAAALVLLVVGVMSLTQLNGGITDVDVVLDTATAPPVAGQPADDEPDPASIDAADSGEPAPPAAPTSTPAPRPSTERGAAPPPPTADPTSVPATVTPDPTVASQAPPAEPSPSEPDDPSADQPMPTPTGEAMPSPITPTPEPQARTPEPNDEPTDTSPAEQTPTATPTAGTAPTPEATATSAPTAPPTPTITPEPTATPAPTPTATATPTPEPTATATPTPTATPSFATGTANAVCPSGFRAPLEFASLRYAGTSTGWNRLGDLVNEQEGPYYFLAWEPNFPTEVSVEVTLREPILAADIRVFQDPFTEVSGSVSFLIDDDAFSIELSGVDGWRVHSFAEPTEVGSFTITRREASANIMEVMICRA